MGCFSVTLPPDYAEMGSTRTNKCISTDQAQEKGLDKRLISSQHQGNSQNASRDEQPPGQGQPVRGHRGCSLKAGSVWNRIAFPNLCFEDLFTEEGAKPKRSKDHTQISAASVCKHSWPNPATEITLKFFTLFPKVRHFPCFATVNGLRQVTVFLHLSSLEADPQLLVFQH